MRITLTGIASKYIHQSLAPWCLKAGLDQYGVHMPCSVLELNINQSIFKALAALTETRPELAGFSCYIWNIRYVRSLAASLKLLSPETVIVLGGPEAGSRPESIMAEIPDADYVITGPGEYAFAELCKRLDGNLDVSDIPGLCYRREGCILKNPSAPLPLYIPSPYTRECIQNLNGRIVYAETSRGCPFRCSFCLSGQEEGVTFLPMDQAKEILLAAASSGAKTVKLVDRTFNCHRERACQLFGFLIGKHREGSIQNVCFHFEVAADLFDRETLLLLKSAPPGLFQMEAGLQSFHKKTLEACQRKTDLDRLSYNIQTLLAGGNIHLHIDLIAGLPFEDLKTFAESFNRAFSLNAHMLQLGFLKLLPSSSLFDMREEYGILHHPEPPYEILKSKWLTYKDVCLLKRCEQAVERIYNSGKFRSSLHLALSAGGMPPFALFCRLGDLIARQPGSLSQDALAELAFHFLSGLPGVSRDLLRDTMARDLMASDNTGRLPACLEVDDPRLKMALRALRQSYPPGAKLGAFIAYSGGETLHWADYAKPDPVTGRYESRFRPLADFLSPGPACAPP